MKNNIYIIALLAISTVGLSTACSSDFLNEELTTQYSTDHFKTPSGLDELSVGTYQKLKFQFNYTWGIKAYNWGVDEFTDANNSGPEYNNYGETLNSTNTEVNSPIWDNYFSGIESANTMITNVPLYYDKSNANYNTRLGEGYFFRGFYYYRLVQQYGGVPLKLQPSSGVETSFTRASEEACFAQIISDLEQAYTLLPTKQDATGKLTKWAAAHFLAAVHLARASELYSSWNKNYQSSDLDAVIKYGKEVVAACPLCPNYVDLWNYSKANDANEKVSEVVLAAQFSDDQNTWGRYGNQMHLYYPAVYQDMSGTKRDISGDREFCYARSTNYTMDVFDRVNDSRFWKSFITCYGCNNSSGAPAWDAAAISSGVCPSGSVAGTKRFKGGQVATKYIVNNAGDGRYVKYGTAEADVLKNGVLDATHTFVRYFKDEKGSWLDAHGNEGYYGAQKRFVALSKYRDGYRIAVASQFGTRDAIIARSAEDALMVAEAYIRQGESHYDDALTYINMIRDRAGYASGENRAINIDGGQAYKNNPYCKDNGGGFSSDGAIFSSENTYYESNNIGTTTESTKSSMHLNSVNDVYNSVVDNPIYQALGCTTNAQKMLCFLLDERTRELCGESLRWYDLARTKTLEARWNAFNDGATRGVGKFDPAKHYYRPIPQSFLNSITNAKGTALSDDEKQAMQNPGY